MIGWFPTPYPDELFYSLCARYSAVCKFPRKLDLSRELFLKNRFIINVEFPTSLKNFVSNLPGKSDITFERIITEHTILPFYAPFLPVDSVYKIKQIMIDHKGRSCRSMAGISNSKVSSLISLRFCPDCLLMDRQLFGETYWHRIHQLTGIDVCTKHLVFLESSEALLAFYKNKTQPMNAEQHIQIKESRPLDLTNPIHQCLLNIAKDAEWLLKNTNICRGYANLRNNYLDILNERKLLSKTGKTYLKRLYNVFREKYPIGFLQILQNDFDETKDCNWLARIIPRLQVNDIHNPLRHLLLIRALGHSPQTFFDRIVNELHFPKNVLTDSYFLPAPYPCLNPTCVHYLKSCINNYLVKRSKNFNNFSLHVICDCGFYYIRYGPDNIHHDKFRKDFIKCYGELWLQTLTELWIDPKNSVHQICKFLDASRGTVISKAHALGLKSPRLRQCNGRPLISEKKQVNKKKPKKIENFNWKNFKLKRLENRKAWLKVLNENPLEGKTRIMKIIPNIATWLIQNDIEWLRANQPIKLEVASYVKKVNWVERDKNLSYRIGEAVERIKLKSGFPVKITTNLIIRELEEVDWLFRIKSRMPLTTSELKLLSESCLEFQMRKVQYVLNQIKSENKPTTFCEVATRAKAYKYNKVPIIRKAIINGVNEINNNLRS